MSGHTPGPWLSCWDAPVDDDTAGVEWGIRNADGVNVVAVGVYDGVPLIVLREPDARLIAAAPDLLEALVMVRDADEDCKRDSLPTIPYPARKRIDAAIAKATGGQS